MSTYEALQTATKNAAQILGNSNIGTVEVGKIADLVLLEGNPLEDLRNVTRVSRVFFRGEEVSEAWMCTLQ